MKDDGSPYFGRVWPDESDPRDFHFRDCLSGFPGPAPIWRGKKREIQSNEPTDGATVKKARSCIYKDKDGAVQMGVFFDLTLAGLRDKLYAEGVTDMVALDGGLSCFCAEGGRIVYDSGEGRKIPNIIVERGEDAATGGEPLSRPVLRKGAKGADVKDLQKLLNRNGATLTVDGEFGPLTNTAVCAYQQWNKLEVDGIVGPRHGERWRGSMTEILVALIAVCGTLATTCLQLKSIRLQKRADSRARRREEESRLSMELMDTSCDLGLVTAKAVTGQKLNGDIKEAMDKAETAQKAYQDFLTRTAAASVAKF